jgi:hypothetical protein
VTDSPLHARLNRHQTRVVCGRIDCGGVFGEFKRAEQPFRVYVAEIGGPRSTTEYLKVVTGEAYIEMLPGFLVRSDGVYDVSGMRLGYQRAHGLPTTPRPAHGDQHDIVKGPIRARCTRCRRENVLDAGSLGIAQRQ